MKSTSCCPSNCTALPCEPLMSCGAPSTRTGCLPILRRLLNRQVCWLGLAHVGAAAAAVRPSSTDRRFSVFIDESLYVKCGTKSRLPRSSYWLALTRSRAAHSVGPDVDHQSTGCAAVTPDPGRARGHGRRHARAGNPHGTGSAPRPCGDAQDDQP